MYRTRKVFVKGSSNLKRQEKGRGVKPEQVYSNRTRYHLPQRGHNVRHIG
jgi:hypothetical protein